MALGARNRSAIKHEGVHGTAHWASRTEIEATGLLTPRRQAGAGVYVGGWSDECGDLHYLRHDGPEHIAAIAPTRSGKGVGLVVPTLLSWPHSVVVNDQKAELWNLTAAWRERWAHNVVMRFDPGASEGSVGFNPLEEIRLGHDPRGGGHAEPGHHPGRPRGQGPGRPLGQDRPRLPHRRRAPCALQGQNHGQDRGASRRGPGLVRSGASGRGALQGDARQPMGPQGNRASDHRRGGARHDQPPRRGARLGAVDRHVVPVAVPRSAGGEERVPLGLQGHGPDEPRQAGDPLSGGPRRGQGPDEAADAADHQPAGPRAAASRRSPSRTAGRCRRTSAGCC